MKQNLTVLAVFLASLLGSLVLVPTPAHAGDDYVASVAYTGTAACSAVLKAKTNYAVRCTTDCYVRVTSDTLIVSPPLIVSEAQVGEITDKIRKVIKAVA